VTGPATILVGADPGSAAVAPAPPDEADLAALLMIRHFEQALLRLFADGRLNGTTHTCLGQEHIPVALMRLLRPGDFVLSNHRGHGHYLARFDDPAGLLAEITGREGAVCRGVGGSQHLHRPGYVSTGVQGESLPVAAGVALHFQRSGRPNVAVAFVGDGTWGEGAMYETLNIAALWRLPLLVVVENNHIAQSTPEALHTAGDIAGRAAAFGIAHVAVTGHDLAGIRERLSPVTERVLAGGGPAVAEFDTRRLGPHSKGDDTRDEASLAEARDQDWYAAYRAAWPELFERVDSAQRERVAQVISDVLSRPESSWDGP
jgi:acetoin:2,6-dichlorophenolindophenol oxidoreductase subunit alpha